MEGDTRREEEDGPQIFFIFFNFFPENGPKSYFKYNLKDDDKIIDIEIQSYPQEALGKRTRYYQSMIDIDSLMKGKCLIPSTFRNTCLIEGPILLFLQFLYHLYKLLAVGWKLNLGKSFSFVCIPHLFIKMF